VADGNILMGVVGKPHGVRGLLHVHSFTAEPTDLTRYAPLVDERGRTWSLAWRGEGLAELRDAAGRAVADRTEAEKLVNLRLFAPRDRLPPIADADEFYLADLIGLLAVDAAGRALGRVAAVHDYGAGASLEIARPRANGGSDSVFVPFTRAAVPVVDIPGGQVTILPPDEIEVRAEDFDPHSASEPAAAGDAA
jgi:16S rRNA processing protein RimM